MDPDEQVRKRAGQYEDWRGNRRANGQAGCGGRHEGGGGKQTEGAAKQTDKVMG